MSFSSEFFLAESGRSPVEEFLETLDVRSQQKFLYARALLEEFGARLGMPFCKYLKNGIFELRFKGREGALRVMYFF